MPQKIIKNWRCSKCGYVQDFEPTIENNEKYFSEYPDLKPGQCPSCKEGKLEEEK